jgi:hypothetical protein
MDEGWVDQLKASMALAARESPSIAHDIPLFSLRKKLRKAEEEAEEIAREGFITEEKGIGSVERGIVKVEKGIKRAEREIETEKSFGGVVGILVATLIVNERVREEGVRHTKSEIVKAILCLDFKL